VTNVDEMAYVRILRDLREDADKTQTQIAEVLGTSQTMYARYERGANELPIHHLITLSKYYGVSTDYLSELTPYGVNGYITANIGIRVPRVYRYQGEVVEVVKHCY
jgi:transcriptional regulator with XRE-family HTH domain